MTKFVNRTALGSFDFIESQRYGLVKHMHVWDGSSDAHISFENEDESDLAIIVENNLIQASLTRELNKFENLTVLHSSLLRSIDETDSTVELTLNDSSVINTNLLIGSDGPNSFIRQSANFKVTKWDYDQVAIVATLKLSQVWPFD